MNRHAQKILNGSAYQSRTGFNLNMYELMNWFWLWEQANKYHLYRINKRFQSVSFLLVFTADKERWRHETIKVSFCFRDFCGTTELAIEKNDLLRSVLVT